MTDAAARSLEILRQRVDGIPDAMAHALTTPLPVATSARRWIVTGVGASEGPARFLVALLCDGGLDAVFLPLSSFSIERVPAADVCVVFSQSLSPNARLALRLRARFARMWVVSAVDPNGRLAAALAARDIELIAHRPADEDGLLIRMVGPAAACVVSARLAQQALGGIETAWSGSIPRLPQRFSEIACAGAPQHARILLVTAGHDPFAAEGLRLKFVEGLGVPATTTDVCGVVHGPFQSFWDHPTTLVSLEHEQDPARDLFDRLARSLAPRHQHLRIRAALPPPLSYVEHAAAVDQIVIAGLASSGRDLARWPGEGEDAALYDLGRDELQ